MNEQFILILVAIAITIFFSMLISTVLFCKRVEISWKRLYENKEIEITNI